MALNIGKRLAELSLANAEATQPEDQDTIRSLVIEEMGSFEEIDKVLRANIKVALEVSKKCIEDDFDRLFHSLARSAHRATYVSL